MAAVSVAKLLGIDRSKIEDALQTFKFPKGRQEIIYDKEFKAVVDFAHTPNSFTKILHSLKKNTKGRLIHVFGAAGLRDSSKRPLMGKVAADYDDVIILTAEDPRSEKISEINTQIKLGIVGFRVIKNYKEHTALNESKIIFEIPDRLEAVKFAVKLAQIGDTIVATGKGHEESMNLGEGEIPWSDHEAFEKAINSKNG